MSYYSCDDKITCPYNRFHVVSRLRILQHVTNCRKQNPHLAEAIDICPYNQAHHVPSEDMKTHLQSCREHAALQMYGAPFDSFPKEANKSELKKKRVEVEVTQESCLPASSEVDDDIAEWM